MSETRTQRKTFLKVIPGRGYGQKTDAELVVLCQEQDAAAFEELVRRHERSVYALLYKLAPDWSDTADLAQEAFVRMWRGICNLQNPHAFRAWLNQIVTHLFYDELRKRPRQLPTVSMDYSYEHDDEEEPTRDIPDSSACPAEIAERKELSELIRGAMDTLPEHFRTAIVLRELQGLSYEEIAQITDTDLGTVKSRIFRARSKVQQLLQPYLDHEVAA